MIIIISENFLTGYSLRAPTKRSGFRRSRVTRNVRESESKPENSNYTKTLKNKAAQDFGPLTHFRSKLDIIVFHLEKANLRYFRFKPDYVNLILKISYICVYAFYR